MVLFNHGESTHDVKKWLQTRLRLQHASSVISNAVEFHPMERFLLEKLIHAEGTGNRIRIESDATGRSVIRAGDQVRELTRQGLNDIADYLSQSQLQNYFEIDRHTPTAARYTAGGTYHTALERTIYNPLRKKLGEDISVSIATYGKGVPTNFFEQFMVDGQFTALTRADNEGRMTVIRARRGDGTWITDDAMIQAATGHHGPLAINNAKGKLAKRLTAAVVGDSAYQVSLNRSVRAGFVDPKVLFEAFQKHNTTISSGVLQSLGSLAPDNIKYMLDNPEILERGVDGAILLNNRLVDDIIKGHKRRLQNLMTSTARSYQTGGMEQLSASFHSDQVRRLKKNIEILERHAEQGGRFSNFRAMGFEMGALDARALGLTGDTEEAIAMLSRSMAKGDAFLMPRGKARLSNYEMLMGQVENILKRYDSNTQINLRKSDFMALTRFKDKKGLFQPTLAATAELGNKGEFGSLVGLNPTETLSRVRMNVENITGARIIFRAGREGRNYAQGLQSNVARTIEEAKRTGTIPVGYLRDLVTQLEKSERVAEAQGREAVVNSLANQRNRAVRLIERAMSGATFDDPMMVREFSNMMIASMTRGGGKIDPIMEMTSSVWGHVGTDMFAAMKGNLPSQGGLAHMRTIADDHMLFDKDLGFIMNMPTAGRSYHQFGGFDLDDALEAHLRWGKNEATGRTELFSVTTRTPMSGGEGGVFKVWGFQDSPDVRQVMPFVQRAVEGDREAEEAFRIARKLSNMADSMDRLKTRDEEWLAGRMDKRLADLQTYFDENVTSYSNFDEYIESIFDTSEWQTNWRTDGLALARSLAQPRGEAGLRGTSKLMDDFVQRFIDKQKNMWDEDYFKDGQTAYEHAKQMLDRRLSSQVAHIKEGPLSLLHAEGQLPSAVFGTLDETQKKSVLVELAERGVLFPEREKLWKEAKSGRYILDDAQITKMAKGANEATLRDILDNRILKLDTMSSFEAWSNDLLRKDTGKWHKFMNITGRVADQDTEDLQDFLRRLENRPAGADAKTWAKKMIMEYDTMTRNPSLLGRSVNVTAIIDEMNSGLLEMRASDLIDDADMRSLRKLVPYMDTETLVDTLTQGADDPRIFETITRTYYGQVHGAGALMGEVERILQKASTKTGTPVDELTAEYGLSWRLFKERLRPVLSESPGSPAKQIFFNALGMEVPESPEALKAALIGRPIFGGGQYEKFLQLESDNRAMVSNFREAHLSDEMRRVIPELRGEVFYNNEIEKASFLQDVFEEAKVAHRTDIDLMGKKGHAISRIADELQTVVGRDVADELAARSVVTAFMDNFMQGDEIAEDGWRAIGALLKTSKSNQLLNSGTFSPLTLGAQAFFGRKAIAERLGDEAQGMSARELFKRDLEDRFDALDPSIKKQQRKIAKEQFPKANNMDEALDLLREKIAAEREAAMTVRVSDLMGKRNPVETTVAEFLGSPETNEALAQSARKGLPSFEEWQQKGTDALTGMAKGIHQSHYRRLTKQRVMQYMDVPAVKKVGLAALGLTAFSFLYQRNQKREEEMLGQSLPGGGSYMTPIPTTQMEIASQYVPPSASGVTYNVNIRGGDSGMREQLESITGISSSGSRYNSLPKPGGSRSAFSDIQDAF